jgi:colicin import membrane protein
MADYFSEYWKYLFAALVLHGGIVAMLFVTIAAQPVRVTPQLAIQATVVDASTLRRVEQRDAEREREQREREAAAERERLAAERLREQQEAQEQADAERRQEEQRQAEAQRQAQVRQQAEAEAQRQAAEKARAAQAAQAERERRDAAEKQRVAEIEKRQREAAEQRRAAEAAKAQAAAEDDLRRQLAEETGRMQAENAGLNNQYAALIEQRVYRNWNRPATARPGIECQVRVRQARGGTVLSVEVGQCNGDAAVRQSIEAAVLRSSPLPPPPDPRLFQDNLLLIFKPQD